MEIAAEWSGIDDGPNCHKTLDPPVVKS